MAPIRRLLALALLLFAAVAPADELRWRSLDVTAKIDDEGTLHASERHTMIFDGEWNGGQRTIPLRGFPPPQQLTFDRVARVVSAKKTVDLTRVGDAPDQIDEYGVYNDGTTIRWRARLADAPRSAASESPTSSITRSRACSSRAARRSTSTTISRPRTAPVRSSTSR